MTWTCSYCGQPNLMHYTHCSRCGRPRGNKHHLRRLKIKRSYYCV